MLYTDIFLLLRTAKIKKTTNFCEKLFPTLLTKKIMQVVLSEKKNIFLKTIFAHAFC